MISRRAILLLAAFCGVSLTAQANNEQWPTKPIRIIVSQPPGAAPDIAARLIGEKMTQSLGQAVIVENRPGGGNIIGAQAAAKSAPDGYTFFLGTAAALAVNPYAFKTLPYDPLKDFVPVGMVGGAYFMVVANKDLPVKTFDDLLKWAKANPDKVSFGSDGQKGFAGILGEWINKRAGTSMLQVPYVSAAQSIQETIAGRTQVTIQATPAVMPFVSRGQVKALAISSPGPVKGLENIPPIARTLPDVQLYGWLAIVAPKGLPAPTAKKFNSALDSALKEPTVQQRMEELGFYSEGASTPEALGKYIQAEHARWGKITNEIGLVAD